MENVKLVDVGVFLYNKKLILIITAVIVAILTVTAACILQPAYSASCTLTSTYNFTLPGSIVSQNQQIITNNVNAAFPSDDAAVSYIEGIKITKASQGRTNPFLAENIISAERNLTYLTANDLIVFLSKKGYITADFTVSVIGEGVTLTYESATDAEKQLSQIVEDIKQYLLEKNTDTVNAIRASHEALVKRDDETINNIINNYNSLPKTNGIDEQRRSILNDYAQAAYDRDLSNAVISYCDSLVAAGLAPDISVTTIKGENSRSVLKIIVFAVAGFVIGLVIGAFIAFLIDLCCTIRRTAIAKRAETKKA